MIVNIVIIFISQYISCLLLLLSFFFFFSFSLTLVCHEMNSIVKKFMGFSSVCLYKALFRL